ncbi:hypothetical protein [Corynebacterium kalinowskii]|uniref:hypothetical protein n=1 Tax=Corynebacterium kalinowskii TaxID=2675216 RepID=UPI0012E29733|nr:hypothetical protein [Corynebacterium kalinowskii]
MTLISAGNHRRCKENVYFLRPMRELQVWHPDLYFRSLAVSEIHHAAVDCLQLLEKERHTWRVPKVPGITDVQVRQVQLLDELRHRKLLDGTQLVDAATGRFSRSKLYELGKLSDPHAQSPRETILRLILRDIPNIESQVRIDSPTGQLLTTADLAVPRLKVAAFYDGEAHLAREQRDYDSKVWALLSQMGWRCLRVTSGMLSDPRWIVAHFLQLLAMAEAEIATLDSQMIRQPKAKPDDFLAWP